MRTSFFFFFCLGFFTSLRDVWSTSSISSSSSELEDSESSSPFSSPSLNFSALSSSLSWLSSLSPLPLSSLETPSSLSSLSSLDSFPSSDEDSSSSLSSLPSSSVFSFNLFFCDLIWAWAIFSSTVVRELPLSFAWRGKIFYFDRMQRANPFHKNLLCGSKIPCRCCTAFRKHKVSRELGELSWCSQIKKLKWYTTMRHKRTSFFIVGFPPREATRSSEEDSLSDTGSSLGGRVINSPRSILKDMLPLQSNEDWSRQVEISDIAVTAMNRSFLTHGSRERGEIWRMKLPLFSVGVLTLFFCESRVMDEDPMQTDALVAPFWAEASAAMEALDFDAAESIFMKALQESPNTPEIVDALGDLLVQKGDLGRAKKVDSHLFLFLPPLSFVIFDSRCLLPAFRCSLIVALRSSCTWGSWQMAKNRWIITIEEWNFYKMNLRQFRFDFFYLLFSDLQASEKSIIKDLKSKIVSALTASAEIYLTDEWYYPAFTFWIFPPPSVIHKEVTPRMRSQNAKNYLMRP